jgi:pyruvate, orthophosphate dikinase
MITAKGSGQAVKVKPRVYLFSDAFKSFNGNPAVMRETLGGKGAGLAEMTASGVNVPPGLTIITACCNEYYDNGNSLPGALFDEIKESLAEIERASAKKLGDVNNPLLLSVRSGAKFSMPGMMDTILNLGTNDQTVESLARLTNNARFAWDNYRRFIQMYGSVVLEIPKDVFEDCLDDKKEELGITNDTDLTESHLKHLVNDFKLIIRERAGDEFPQDAYEQLLGAIQAVFRSWNNSRAIYYRNFNKIDHNLGTAVNIQAMVFGNMDNNSGTGVCFTRNPATGEKHLYGEYLVNAQGEDVVAGVRTPKKISDLADEMPAVYWRAIIVKCKTSNSQ